MPAPARSEGGQRRYEEQHAKRLAFIRHSRELGFPLDAVRELLRLSDQPNESCENVDRVARQVLADVEAKIERLLSLQTELRRLVRQGKHGKVGECRIIAVLADHSHSQCLTLDHGPTAEGSVAADGVIQRVRKAVGGARHARHYDATAVVRGKG